MIVWKYRVARLRERIQRWIAWSIPQGIVYWVGIRMSAHATQGPWSNEHPDRVSIMDMLNRWPDQGNGE